LLFLFLDGIVRWLRRYPITSVHGAFGDTLLHYRADVRLELVEVDEAIFVGVPFVAFGTEVFRHLVVVEQAIAVEIVAAKPIFGPAIHHLGETEIACGRCSVAGGSGSRLRKINRSIA